MEMAGSSKFLGNPDVPFAHAQMTPVRRQVPDRDVRETRFQNRRVTLGRCTAKALTGNKTFEAQSHMALDWLRFAGIVIDHHARLASGRW